MRAAALIPRAALFIRPGKAKGAVCGGGSYKPGHRAAQRFHLELGLCLINPLLIWK